MALARARSLEVRRRNALAKVEGKVNHLRSMLGSDLKPDTVSRIAKEMIAVEEQHEQEVERLREKAHRCNKRTNRNARRLQRRAAFYSQDIGFSDSPLGAHDTQARDSASAKSSLGSVL